MINVLFGAAAVVTAIGVIGGAAIYVYRNGDRFIVWLLKKLYGHSGGLRIIKAKTKGIWRHRDGAALLTSDWYASSLIENRPITILTVSMIYPSGDLDGVLVRRDGLPRPESIPSGSVHVPPKLTAIFDAHFVVPSTLVRKGKEVKVEIIFTDSFNNPHRKKVTFRPED